jgi:hypothetical protein
LDLPQPLGPTIAERLVGKGTVVASTNDLKPASLILLRRMVINKIRGSYNKKSRKISISIK